VRTLVLAALAATACRPVAQPSPPARPASANGPHIVVFSDLHFNPFSDSTLVDSLQRADVSRWDGIFRTSTLKTYSAYGSDTNYPLLESALSAMHGAEPAAGLVLIAGDFLAHGFQYNFKRTARDTSAAALEVFTGKTNQYLARRIAAAFPDAQILPALGNNDSSCGDYASEPGAAFLRAFAQAWQPAVNRGGAAPDFVATFSAAGHYSAVAPLLRARVVVLSNVYWTPRYANSCGSPTATPGRDAMTWLTRVLAESKSRGESVVLLSHVPVGVDVYATLHSDTVVTMIRPGYTSELVSLLARFGATVRSSIYGHTHMTEFRVMSDSTGNPLVGNQGIPAVSPIFGNNPAFVVMTLDSASGSITDYRVHTLTNLSSASVSAPGVWSTEYDFRDAFGGDGLSATSLTRVERSLAVDTIARARFMRFYDSGSGRAGPSAAAWPAYWCGIASLDPTTFNACYKRPARSP
jgi:hypothetical protein